MEISDTIKPGHNLRLEVAHRVVPCNGLCSPRGVANDKIDEISLIDAQTNTLIGNISTNPYYYPLDVYFDPYNGMVYAATSSSPDLLVINPGNETIVDAIPLSGNGGSPSVALFKNYLYFTEDGPHYNDIVQVINTSSYSVVSTITVGI
ncbi:MAG: hypothetical protein M1151_02250 [Candidatus Thermoplasmatota archaeon]|nr:hypothetical protein [Candidatus Thermoplasmatota archaeon]MCL5785477.1 hypothetical protein [Candidatus Thermoplasmatota archaeon]